MPRIEIKDNSKETFQKIDQQNERIEEHGKSEIHYISKTIAKQLYNHKRGNKIFDMGSRGKR